MFSLNMCQISEQLQDAPLTKLISHFIELPKSQLFLKEYIKGVQISPDLQDCIGLFFSYSILKN